MFRKIIIMAIAAGGLAGCSAATVQRDVGQARQVAHSVKAACDLALPLAGMAAAIPTVGAFVAAGVQVGCGTEAGVAKLLDDPSSAAWLGQQAQMLKAALGGKHAAAARKLL